MIRQSTLLAVVFAVGLSGAGVEAQQTRPSQVLKAGFAEGDITPAIGMEQPGGYGKVFHRGLHDPCRVRAAVFDDGATRVAIVGVDALMVPRSLVTAARAEIRDRCGIAPEAVLIGASHSHSSGPTGMVQPGEFDHASPLVRSLAYEKSSCADAAYLARVRREIVAAVEEANARRTEARCGVGTGIEDQVAFNRRFRMRNGLTFTHPGKGNPDIVGVAGPTDPQVGVIGAWDMTGGFLGCLVNFACHATTNPGGISANWIHYLETTIRGAMGAGATVVFLQGFCGDVTQVDNLSRYDERPGEDGARFVGARVGAEAVKVLASMQKGTLRPVSARTQVLRLPRRMPAPQRVARCRELVQKDPAAVGQTEWTFAKEIILLDAILAREPLVEAEIQAIQIGPAVFLAAPGEMFCRLGLDLKAASGFSFTFPVELANGCVGYVPAEEAFGEHGGGYETRLTSYSNLSPDAGRKMVDAALGLARGLKPGEVPVRRPAPPFKAPWSYGDVAPESK
ncbi:MAG: hypothetical protein ACPMAQ_02365 [Phycisphaerae bacterium]